MGSRPRTNKINLDLTEGRLPGSLYITSPEVPTKHKEALGKLVTRIKPGQTQHLRRFFQETASGNTPAGVR